LMHQASNMQPISHNFTLSLNGLTLSHQSSCHFHARQTNIASFNKMHCLCLVQHHKGVLT